MWAPHPRLDSVVTAMIGRNPRHHLKGLPQVRYRVDFPSNAFDALARVGQAFDSANPHFGIEILRTAALLLVQVGADPRLRPDGRLIENAVRNVQHEVMR